MKTRSHKSRLIFIIYFFYLPLSHVYATFTLMEMQGKVILAVGAHPDDLEFFVGGTIAKYSALGAKVYYLILTDGSKGSEDHLLDKDELVQIRQDEQRKAAEILGVMDMFFFAEIDGELENTLLLRKKIVEIIRTVKPDTVVTFDPSYLYDVARGMVNHPDHRTTGQATIDAVFPFSRNKRTFPELLEQGQDVHSVTELLLVNLNQYNFVEDITPYLDQKIKALGSHISQKDDSEDVIRLVKNLCLKEKKKSSECFVKITLAP